LTYFNRLRSSNQPCNPSRTFQFSKTHVDSRLLLRKSQFFLVAEDPFSQMTATVSRDYCDARQRPSILARWLEAYPKLEGISSSRREDAQRSRKTPVLHRHELSPPSRDGAPFFAHSILVVLREQPRKFALCATRQLPSKRKSTSWPCARLSLTSLVQPESVKGECTEDLKQAFEKKFVFVNVLHIPPVQPSLQSVQ